MISTRIRQKDGLLDGVSRFAEGLSSEVRLLRRFHADDEESSPSARSGCSVGRRARLTWDPCAARCNQKE